MIGFARKHFLGVEVVVALAVTAAFVVWAEYWGGHATFRDLLQDRRATVYGTFAAIAGSLLGFVLATVSIVLGMVETRRMKRVRESATYPTLWRVFTSSIKWLGFTTCALLVGLIFDRDGAPVPALLYLAAFSVILSLLRLWSCIWVLEQIIKTVSLEKRKEE